MTKTTPKKPNNPKKPIVLGLTGPTGSGKTVLADALRARGAAVVDADAVARLVVEKGEPCLAALAERFGADILEADGSLNRRALAKKAFANDGETAALTAITHPFILSRMRDEMRAAADRLVPLIVIDAPLLFESHFDAECDKTVAVLASEETRRARICARDGLSAEEAAARIARQPQDDFYTSRADLVLQNDGDVEPLQTAAAELWRWQGNE